MIVLSVPPLARSCAGRVSAGIVLRVALALGALSLAVLPTMAATLKGDVVASADVLKLGDLVEGLPAAAAAKPAFRAPALGESGTIQARRIVEAAEAAGITGVETQGRAQVTISRAARRIGAAEIEAAVKAALERQQVDARPLSILFEGTPPALLVAPEVTVPVTAEDVTFDRRSRRVTATVWVGPSPAERRAVARVAGSAVELVEVAVLSRPLARGEALLTADLATERRPREQVPTNAAADASGLAGRVARRALPAGTLLRAADLARPEVVVRGEPVTMIYEIPGMSLSTRGRANESGAVGDVIAVLNPQSKRTVQAVVTGPGRVSVSAALPGPIAGPVASAQR
ncbi:MAG TPA: flagellar basal body P-ring formation chaperone FlgA [Beijerinckiaceae bacterium]|jgi:flagella basal body P-ring formation protein FlgA